MNMNLPDFPTVAVGGSYLTEQLDDRLGIP
jgi:hypothetical protein